MHSGTQEEVSKQLEEIISFLSALILGSKSGHQPWIQASSSTELSFWPENFMIYIKKIIILLIIYISKIFPCDLVDFIEVFL